MSPTGNNSFGDEIAIKDYKPLKEINHLKGKQESLHPKNQRGE